MTENFCVNNNNNNNNNNNYYYYYYHNPLTSRRTDGGPSSTFHHSSYSFLFHQLTDRYEVDVTCGFNHTVFPFDQQDCLFRFGVLGIVKKQTFEVSRNQRPYNLFLAR